MNQLQEYLQFAIDVAKQSGQIILEWHQEESFKVNTKANEKDLVNKVEQFIFESLKERFPKHRFISEGSVNTCKQLDSDDPTWIVNPIDGTVNLVHFLPWCCVSIGLAINQELVLGVINCPYLRKIYTAIKGGGARCNNIPTHVSSTNEVEKAMILTDISVSYKHPEYPNFSKNIFESIIWKCQGYRCIGSCCISMCFIAEGCTDAYFMNNLKIWNVAAGYVITKEAGGFIYNMNGDEFDPNDGSIIAACNPSLAKKIAECIKKEK